MTNPRAFIDKNGNYQSTRSGIDKEAHDAWVESNTWNLTWDDFVRLSYFQGCLEQGSDGSGPINSSGQWNAGDIVYMTETGNTMTRDMVSYWLSDYRAFTYGYKTAIKNRQLSDGD